MNAKPDLHDLCRRVRDGEFAAMAHIAKHYGAKFSVVHWWRREAVRLRLISSIDWEKGLARGQHTERYGKIDAADALVA